jgi:hypothetical protein
MTNRLLAALAFAVLAGFVGILVWYVPRLDLGAVVAVTVLLAGYDFYRSAGSEDRDG